MSEKYSMTIGGESVAADDYSEIRNPANTEDVVGYAPVGTAAHLDRAVAAAKQAFDGWRHSSDADRAAGRIHVPEERGLRRIRHVDQLEAGARVGHAGEAARDRDTRRTTRRVDGAEDVGHATFTRRTGKRQSGDEREGRCAKTMGHTGYALHC